jgi:hypothetical protein
MRESLAPVFWSQGFMRAPAQHGLVLLFLRDRKSTGRLSQDVKKARAFGGARAEPGPSCLNQDRAQRRAGERVHCAGDEFPGMIPDREAHREQWVRLPDREILPSCQSECKEKTGRSRKRPAAGVPLSYGLAKTLYRSGFIASQGSGHRGSQDEI